MAASMFDARRLQTAEPMLLRAACAADVTEITALQRRAFRVLGASHYTAQQIESYLAHMPTLEEHLIEDRTYFVGCIAQRIVGCGGWSLRTPAYDALISGGAGSNPATPKVRAMYVDPDFARRGVGRALLEAIERSILAAGYDLVALEATYPGVPLYERCDYVPVAPGFALLPNGVRLPMLSMRKKLAHIAGANA